MKNKTLPLCTILCVLSLIGLNSCQTNQFENELKKVDSLLVKLDSAENIHSQIDTAYYAKAGNTLTTNLKWIDNSYKQKNDTMDRATADFISEYRMGRKAFDKMNKSYSKIGDEISFSREQVKDLKHDLDENALTPVLAEKYVSQEEIAVNSILHNVKSLNNNLKSGAEIIEKNTAKMDSIKLSRSSEPLN